MKWYRFKDLEITSSKKPQNTHLWIEVDDNIYLVDSEDQTSIYNSTDKGANWVQIDLDPNNIYGGANDKERPRKIQNVYHDRTNQIIWFAECDNDGVDDTIDIFTLDYSGSVSSPSITEVSDHTYTDNTVRLRDIIISGETTYCLFQGDVVGDANLFFYECDADPWTYKAQLGWADVEYSSFMIDISGVMYFYSYVASTIYFFKYTGGVGFTNLDSQVGYITPDVDFRSLQYDGDDTIYFIAKKTADSKNYLGSYSITGDIITMTPNEYNISLMLDRNCSEIIPNELEKGFGTSNKKVYIIKARRGGIYQTQDLSDDVSADIIAITDDFLMDDNGMMFEFVDLSDEIKDCNIEYKMGNVTTCSFISTIALGITDSVKFYDDNDNLLFLGYVVEKIYSDTNEIRYQAISYDSEINTYKITRDETAGDTDAKTIIEEILDDANWLHYSSTSITSPAINIKADFNNLCFKDIMDTIADRCDFVWYITPDGTVYFNDGTTTSEKTVSKTSGISNAPTIKLIETQINLVTLYGGYVSGARITTDHDSGYGIDQASIQLNGVIPYVDHFPHTTDQDELNTLSDAILTRSGMSNNPYYIDTGLFGQGFIQCGNTINFTFAPLNYDTDDDILLSYSYNAKHDEGQYQLSTGIVHNTWRGYGRASDFKTKRGDEEQLDILANSMDAEAVAAVEAAGLALDNGKVITSQDADLTFLLGRAAIGYTTADQASFGHKDHFTTSGVALRQTASGITNLNAPTGASIYHRINNVDKMVMSASALTTSIPIAMGTSKITGLGDPVDAQDAATKAYIDTQEAIGSTNKRWRNCILEGAAVFDDIKVLSGEYKNTGAGNAGFAFGIPLEYIKGTHNLVITRVKISLVAADADDYILSLALNSWVGADSSVTQRIGTNGDTYWKTPQVITWDIADLTVGGVFERVALYIACNNTTASQLEIGYAQVEYYYTE